MHIVTSEDLSDGILQELFISATDFERGVTANTHPLKDRIMATLFLEQSTRTRMSFESAMIRLGGTVISCPDGKGSSAVKGETDYDSILTVCNYADVIVVRTPNPWPNLNVRTPANYPAIDFDLINAGDGSNNHPTQALADAYTIWKKFGRLDNLTIGIAGDLKKSRTIHSFVEMMGRQKNNMMILLDTVDGDQTLGKPQPCAHTYANILGFYEFFPDMDVIYTNRVQRERHDQHVWSSNFALSPKLLGRLPDHAIVMNPGPRREELPPELDANPKVVFFQQVRNGMFARMALLKYLLDS